MKTKLFYFALTSLLVLTFSAHAQIIEYARLTVDFKLNSNLETEEGKCRLYFGDSTSTVKPEERELLKTQVSKCRSSIDALNILEKSGWEEKELFYFPQSFKFSVQYLLVKKK